MCAAERTITRAALAGLPLAPDPIFAELLRGLLAPAIPLVLDHARELDPRVLLLMGSAACGEATGVRAGGGWLPLSDLDLGLFVTRAATAAHRETLRRDLDAALQPQCAALGLSRNPIDAGVFPIFYLRRMPLTLELAEAARRPVVLWGDAGSVAWGAREPRPFEALRLVANRVAETVVPLRAAREEPAPQAGLPAWPEAASEADWRAAHRWSKLVVDAGKGWCAARGIHEPSLRERARLLARESPTGDTPALPAGELGLIRSWTAWRLQPAWPPPPRDAGMIAALARRTVVAAAAGGGAKDLDPGSRGFDAGSSADWRRLLAGEGGSARERLRRWRWMLRARPAEISVSAAVALALGWHRAWPRSLATLALLLAWICAADAPEAGRGSTGEGAREGERVREALNRAFPFLRAAAPDGRGAAWTRGLETWLEWVGRAGV